MTELIFKGKFESKNVETFLEKLKGLFKETGTTFSGSVYQFEVQDYTEYEEVIENDSEETN